MFYEFPIIENINEFREKLTDPTTFHETNKGEYTVFNYNGLNPDNFPPILTGDERFIRECRGIAFDNKTGVPISRPFHKFFNYGEREETMFWPLPDEQLIGDRWVPGFISFTKLDGSMIHSMPLDKGVRLATKAGITDVSMMAEVFAATKENYQDFLSDMWNIYKCTPIFEFTSRKQKIVIDYPEDALTILDIRSIRSGDYLPVEVLRDIANDFKIPFVEKRWDGSDSLELVSRTKELENEEGIVVRFFNGHRFKIKGDWYVKLHRYIDVTKSDRHFVKAYLSEEWDDIFANADPVIKQKLSEAKRLVDYDIDYYAKDLFIRILKLYKEAGVDVWKSEKTREDRKNFAFAVNETKLLTNWESKIAFKTFVDMPSQPDENIITPIIKLQLVNILRQAAAKQQFWEERGEEIVPYVFDTDK